MRWPVPAAASSPIPAVLVKLGPLDTGRIADLRPYFDSVPDPRARRGRWYSLTAILLVCACAVVSGRGASTNSPSGDSVPRTHC
ncbi:transposase family protein [Streptomyces sp. H-KF8]|uniref:transposase family protein n=2 Tax=unclassified Streptomyces TaxID=2593676 RepID=UPI001F444F86|nr:transposase family protein [Streptomyces sp. H-KF8]